MVSLLPALAATVPPTDTPFRSTLSKSQRKDYIRAVQCLQSKPAKTPSSEVPGAKTRFDDFVALHIQQTMEIHYTGNFLSWHRLYTWLYEEALRNECGYTGTQPVRFLPPQLTRWLADFGCLTVLELGLVCPDRPAEPRRL